MARMGRVVCKKCRSTFQGIVGGSEICDKCSKEQFEEEERKAKEAKEKHLAERAELSTEKRLRLLEEEVFEHIHGKKHDPPVPRHVPPPKY